LYHIDNDNSIVIIFVGDLEVSSFFNTEENSASQKCEKREKKKFGRATPLLPVAIIFF
jgi:hypothetical protein